MVNNPSYPASPKIVQASSYIQCSNIMTSVARWLFIFQYLAVYIIEYLPRSIKIANVGTKDCQIQNQNQTKNFPKT